MARGPDKRGVMNPTHPLSLVIASDDWFARQLFADAAQESGAFSQVIAVDDGYSALAETWENVEHGSVPDVYLVDLRSVGLSGQRLITEVRADPLTQHAFIAVLCEQPAAGEYGADICTALDATSPKLP